MGIVLFVELLLKIKVILKKKKERKGKRIPESEKFFIVESEILGFGIRNTAQRIRSATIKRLESRIQVPLQRPESMPVPHGIQNPKLYWFLFHEVT